MADSVVHPWANEDDQGPAITIATLFCLSTLLLIFGIRIWVRSPLLTLFRYDDWTTAAATTIAMSQSVLILVAVRDGLGKRIDNSASQSAYLLNMTLAGSVLYTFALCLGKLAVALLIMRIGPLREHRQKTGILAAVVIAWGVASMVVLATDFNSTSPWKSIHSSLNRWIVIESIGLALEVALLIIIGSLVSGLTTSRSTKMTVLAGFVFRIGLFAIVPIRLYYISTAYNNTSTSYTFAATLPEILAQVEMQCNIIGATVPCLRIFLKHFSSGYLGGVGLDAPDEYHSRSATNNATRGGFADNVKSKPEPGDQDITVETDSIEMESKDSSGNPVWTGGWREGPFDDRASEASITPLNLEGWKT